MELESKRGENKKRAKLEEVTKCADVVNKSYEKSPLGRLINRILFKPLD